MEGDKYGTSGQLAKWYVRMMPEKELCLRKHSMDRNIGYHKYNGSRIRTSKNRLIMIVVPSDSIKRSERSSESIFSETVSLRADHQIDTED